jgi:hypothetical protein
MSRYFGSKYNKNSSFRIIDDSAPKANKETIQRHVHISSLQQIVDLDEKNQILTSNIWLNLDWVDYSLVWNASEYGGVKVGMVIDILYNILL